MKKQLLVLPLATLVLAATGCKKNSVDYSDNSKLKIRFHVDIESDEGKQYDQIIANFNRENTDGITVTATFVARSAGDSTYDTQLAKDKRNGTLPDIFTFDAPKCAAYASYQYLYDISSYFTSAEKAKFVTLNSYKGKLYGVPIQESSAGFFYNKALFDRAHIDVSGITVDNPWTYDQFKDACAKLATLSGITPVDMRMDATESEMATYLLYPFIYASGGSFVDETGKRATGYFNSTGSKRGYQFLKDLLTLHYTNYSIGATDFFTGSVGMYLSSGWTIPDLDHKYTSTFPNRDAWGLLPYPKDVERASANGSWSYAVGNNPRKDKTNVIKLLKYITNAVNSKKITNATGMIPANIDAQESYPANSPEDVLMQQLSKTSRERPVTVGYRQFSDVFRMVISDLGNSNVNTLVDNKAQVLQNELDKIQ